MACGCWPCPPAKVEDAEARRIIDEAGLARRPVAERQAGAASSAVRGMAWWSGLRKAAKT
jgi:3'-phosphoadenosine 5'-phosphosulfate sulfotransferase (PAPS reductase)/FAD synthetase